MKCIFFIYLILFNFFFAIAQKEGNQWINYLGAGMDFNSGIGEFKLFDSNMDMWRTNASICDSNGQLMIYTNGFSVYNRNYQLMENGDSLEIGDYLLFGNDLAPTPDGAIILPFPGDTSKYYIFHMDLDWVNTTIGMALFPKHLFYSVANISLNAGDGAIESGNKNISVLYDTLTQFGMQAVKHGNGRDWWLVCHEYGSNGYYKFLIDPSGVHGPYFQNAGIKYKLVNAQVSSPMKFSNDGNLFLHQSRDSNIIELFAFDRCSGELSNYSTFQINESWVPVRGVSLSPSEHYLYVSSNFNQILQFDLQASDIYQSRTVIGTDDGVGDPFAANYYLHQIGSDGKIYICSYDQVSSLHVINNPDEGGIACNFIQRGINWDDGEYWGAGMPNLPNYSLGPQIGSDCDTLNFPTSQLTSSSPIFTFSIYPNPCHQSAQLSITGAKDDAQIFIYNTFGQVLFETKTVTVNQFIHEQLNVKDLSAGMYLVKVKLGGNEFTQKLIKR